METQNRSETGTSINRGVATPCIICDQTSTRPLFRDLKQCTHCQFIYADVPLSQEDVKKIYEDERYFVGGFEGTDYVDYVGEKPALQRNFKGRIKDITRHQSNTQAKSLLEIGSSYGFFLDVVRPFFNSVQGIDITPDGCRYARQTLNLSVTQGDFLQTNIAPETFDTVCMWDTIEHLHAPHRYVQKVSATLKPGGVFHLTTGDIESWNARWRGPKWRLIHPPTHLYYFSKKTISKLLKRYGFEVLDIKYAGTHRTLNAFLKVLFSEKRRNNRLYQSLKRSKLLYWPIYLNLFDIMHVVAKKS